MLHILEMLGKGIGITLLCILLLLLLLAAAVLFVPVRYKLTAQLQDGIRARGKLSWLFHLVTLSAVYRGEVNVCLRVFGIPVYDRKRREKKAERAAKKRAAKVAKEKPRPKEKKRQKKEAPGPEPHRAVIPAPEEKAAGKGTARLVSPEHTAEADRSGPVLNGDAVEAPADGGPLSRPGFLKRLNGKIKTFFRRIKEFVLYLLDKMRKIRYTWETFCDKIRNVRETVDYYRKVWGSDETRRAFETCRRQLLSLLRNIRPSVCRIYLHIGLEDPSVTGQVLAMQGILYPLLGNNLTIVPEFEEEVLEAGALVKGRITIFVLVKVLWILYFNKDIRRLRALLKKEEM